MMNGKVDQLMQARKNSIQITYPINDRNNCITLLDNQRDQLQCGAAINRHASPKKESSATKGKENQSNEKEGANLAK